MATDKDNLNVRATIIHIIGKILYISPYVNPLLGDILQSIGVIIASILIWISPEKLKLADPILTFLFALIVMFTTLRVARDCLFVLMEGTPMELDLEEFEAKLSKLEGVNEVHDLHVWSLGVGKPAMSAHIFTDQEIGPVLKNTTELCRKYGIYHSTIQIEITRDKGHQDYIDCNHNIH